MKRTMIVMFALAMLLVWTGSAMAQLKRDKCPTAYGNHLLTFPYFPGMDGGAWWNGIAVMNKTGGDIPYGSLCLEIVSFGKEDDTLPVLNKDEGYSLEFKDIDEDGVLKQGGMVAMPLDDADEHDKRMVIALFGKTAANNVTGFAMFGNVSTGEAQGYFALQNARSIANGTGVIGVRPTINGTEGLPDALADSPEVLSFDYTPGTTDGWWRGMAVYSPTIADAGTAYYRFNVFYEGGGESYSFDKTLKKDQMLVGLLDDLGPNVGSSRAMVTVQQNSTNSTVGFGMFGQPDTGNGMGYVANMFEVHNGTDWRRIQNYPTMRPQGN